MENDPENDLESTADWRRRKAEGYPEDTRNEAAAELLEKLAAQLRALKVSPFYRKLGELEETLYQGVDAKGFDLLGLSEALSEYHRGIGFHHFPESAEEYLVDLIQIYSGELETARQAAEEREGALV
jgi:hypothetical protein